MFAMSTIDVQQQHLTLEWMIALIYAKKTYHQCIAKILD